MKKNKTNNYIGILLPLLIILAWQLYSSLGNVSEIIFPKLSSIGGTFVEYGRDGLLIKDIASSIVRVLKGYISGAVIGITLGMLMGNFKTVHKFFGPTLNALRQIAPLAWIPLLMLWFGIGDLSKEILIAMGTFYQTMLNTISGVQRIPQEYLDFAKNYKIKKIDVLFHILIPGAAPSILVGLRLGASSAWMAIIAAEMIAASSGVGYRINAARNLMETEVVLAYMIVIGIIGGFMDYMIKKLTSRLVKWQER